MGVKVRVDRVANVASLVKRLTSAEVLVGIPGDAKPRKEDDGSPVEITDAELGYLHEFGVPEKNIPARPFLIPGVEGMKRGIVDRLRKIGKSALDGKVADIEPQLNSLGLAAQRAVQAKISDGPFVPIKDATKAARLRRKKAYQSANADKRKQMMTDYLAGDFSPLIDTGQLRRSVTYVIAKKGK